MKNILFISLLLCFASLFGVTNIENTQDEIRKLNIEKLDKFKAKYGFVGEQESTSDKSIFTSLSGTFPSPEPIDTTTFAANAKLIASYILSLYNAKETLFTLERPDRSRIHTISVKPDTTLVQYSTVYQQNFYGFPLMVKQEDVPMYMSYIPPVLGQLRISYAQSSRKYYVNNTMVMYLSDIPQPTITRQQAMAIVQELMPKQQPKPVEVKNDGLIPSPHHPKDPPMKSQDKVVYPRYEGCYLYVTPKDNAESYSKFTYCYLITGRGQKGGVPYYIDGITGKTLDTNPFKIKHIEE